MEKMKKNIQKHSFVFVQKLLHKISLPFFITGAIFITTLTPHASHAEIINVTSEKEYNTLLASGKSIFVQIAAEWCGACQAIKQLVDQVASEPEFENIVFIRADADKVGSIATKYNVMGLPTFIYIEKNGTVKKQSSGYKNTLNFKDELRENIRQNLMISDVTQEMEKEAQELAEQLPFPMPKKADKQTPALKESTDTTTNQPQPASTNQSEVPQTETSFFGYIQEFFMGLIGCIKTIIQKISNAIAALFSKN